MVINFRIGKVCACWIVAERYGHRITSQDHMKKKTHMHTHTHTNEYKPNGHAYFHHGCPPIIAYVLCFRYLFFFSSFICRWNETEFWLQLSPTTERKVRKNINYGDKKNENFSFQPQNKINIVWLAFNAFLRIENVVFVVGAVGFFWTWVYAWHVYRNDRWTK